MRVVYCGPPSPTYDFLLEAEGETEVGRLGLVEETWGELLVSHGYRGVFQPDALAATPGVNLHIGYLPWNRGAHPNFWSVYEGTPSGVTLHWMDEGIDTGPIIAQRRVEPEPGDTLRTSYERLQREVTALFIEWWPWIKEGVPGRPQDAPSGYLPGSEHKAADLDRIDLSDGWDTPVEAIRGTGIEGAKRLCHSPA